MTIQLEALLAALLATGIAACTSYDVTGSTGGGGGSGGGGGQGGYQYTASTNSAPWTSGTFSATMSANGQQLSIVGSQVTDSLQISIVLHLAGFRGKGTFDLAAPAGSNALVEYSRLPLTTGNNGLYVTSATATGTAVVTSYNAHTGNVQGTFQFRTVPSGTLGADVPDTVGVTQGHFTGVIVQ